MDTSTGQSIVEMVLPDPEATAAFARQLAKVLTPGLVVYLRGELGTGKTTLVRGFLQAAGFQGRVRSPTYTLVEIYPGVAHFDLYRLADPEELEWLGARDYFGGETLCFIEWPDKGGGMLPAPDLVIELTREGRGRRLTMRGPGRRGAKILEMMVGGKSAWER